MHLLCGYARELQAIMAEGISGLEVNAIDEKGKSCSSCLDRPC